MTLKQGVHHQYSNASRVKQGIYKSDSIAVSNFIQLFNHVCVRSEFRKEG
jgi:succinylarginine dihydrolase